MRKILFAENLKSLRKSNSMIQKELADNVDVDQRTISAWKKSVCEPGFQMLAHLCEIFGETFDSILS